MPLNDAQKLKLKTDIIANTATITIGGVQYQIKDVPPGPDYSAEIAVWYNQLASPSYFVWKSTITRSEIYHKPSLDNTFWDWATYKAQAQGEQGAWTQMFMGDAAPMQNLNFRAGVFAIFSGNAAANTQRAHIFSAGRRAATRMEKLDSVVVSAIGSISPSVNNGNTLTDPLGGVTNPALLGFEGSLTANDVQLARTLPG